MGNLLKNPLKETRSFKRRIILAYIVIFLLTTVLVGRLFDLQVLQHQIYTTLSTKNSMSLLPIPPRRGLIYDRNGLLLAENMPVFSLVITPDNVPNLQTTLTNLAKIISLNDDDITQFYQQLRLHRQFDEIPLKVKLSKEEIASFAVNSYQFPGVTVKANLIRNYPLGEQFSHVVGYVGRINQQELAQLDPINYAATNYIGKTGIEKYYEALLHGQVGYQRVETDANGQVLRTLNSTPPVAGENLYLTIDSQLQAVAENALGNYNGAVVVIQPSTGQVLALVSKPGFDPNLFVDGISSKNYNSLQQDPNYPLFDRVLRGLYPAGSTIKPFVALEGLDSGATTVDFQLFDPGWYQLPNSTHIYHDWLLTGHGWVNITKAIMLSCDTYFFDLAHKMGIDHIDNILDQFGFNQITHIDMPGELPGDIPSPAWKLQKIGHSWYPGDTILTGIGQGYVQVTTLQLAAAVAAMAEHGKRFQPYLLYAEQGADSKIVSTSPISLPTVQLQNQQVWQVVIDAMHKVITQGTGVMEHFGDVPYTVAAKTGTAQVFSVKNEAERNRNLPLRLRDNSLFIAFAPIDNPQIAIAVMVEHGVIAPVVARQVMDYYLLTEKHWTPAPLGNGANN